MCVSLNTTVVTTRNNNDNKTNNVVNKNLSNEPLNLNLPEDFGKETKEINTQDAMDFSKTSKLISVPNVPVYSEGQYARVSEFSPNSAKFEFGTPGEKPLLTIKARNEEVVTPYGRVETNSKASFDSPYLRAAARDYAKDAVMGNVVEPLRDTIGRTAADATLGTAVLATAFVAAKHLPDGNVKVDLPVKKLTGDDSLRAKLIVGYGDGKSFKPTGVEVSDRFQYGDQNIDVKARYRTDSEVNGIKGVNKAEIDILVTDQNVRDTSGSLAFRLGHDKVQGTSAGLFYQKKF